MKVGVPCSLLKESCCELAAERVERKLKKLTSLLATHRKLFLTPTILSLHYIITSEHSNQLVDKAATVSDILSDNI